MQFMLIKFKVVSISTFFGQAALQFDGISAVSIKLGLRLRAKLVFHVNHIYYSNQCHFVMS